MFFKTQFLRFLPRLRPRWQFRWVLSALIWLIVLAYIAFGIFSAIEVYHNKSESKTVKFAVNIYPLPVAAVNGGFIWAKDYYQTLNYIRQFSAKTQQPVPDQAALRKQIIDQLVENKILSSQAVKYHVVVSRQDVNDAYQKIVDQSGGSAEVQKVLNDLYGMSEKQFKELVRQQVLKEKFQNEVMEQVKVSHILVKDQAKATDVANQAKAGGDFAALAKQYSEDTKSAANGGELGWLGRGQLVVNNTPIPEFDNAAFSAKKGEIVGPVQTSIGFEIIKVEDIKGQVNQDYNSWLAGLKKQSKVWVFIR